eukprot:COSAG04_NODE_25282_length_309_cov_1.238095_1_plen_27_part_10
MLERPPRSRRQNAKTEWDVASNGPNIM